MSKQKVFVHAFYIMSCSFYHLETKPAEFWTTWIIDENAGFSTARRGRVLPSRKKLKFSRKVTPLGKLESENRIQKKWIGAEKIISL